MSSTIDLAIDAIRKRGSLRTHDLAELLSIGEAAIDAMLQPARDDGRLICCDVEAGGRKVVEYRASLNGGGKLVTQFKPYRSPAPAAPRAESTSEQVNAGSASQSSGPADQVAPGSRSPLHTREETMTAKEMIVAALKRHGPLTVPQLRAHVKLPGLSGKVSVTCASGAIRKLGGGTKSGIYGLPGQALPGVDALERGGELGRKPAKKRAGGSAAMRRKRRLKRTSAIPVPRAAGAPRPSFRPALTADGAILFLGAAGGDVEVERAHARVFVDLVRRLTPKEVAVAAGFIASLDGGKVGA